MQALFASLGSALATDGPGSIETTVVVTALGVGIGLAGAVWGAPRDPVRVPDRRSRARLWWLVAGWLAFGLLFWSAQHLVPDPWGQALWLVYAPALVWGIQRTSRSVERARRVDPGERDCAQQRRL